MKQQRRHTRQSINCDAKGSPDSKGFPAYSRLPRSTQGYTTPPAHSTGPRRLRGIRTRDIVHLNHKSGQTVTGRATLALKDRRVKIKGQNGQTVTAAPSEATLIAHGSRWSVSQRTAITDQADR